MNEKPERPHPGNRAFTRVDLLALLASSVLLAFIVLPALGHVTGKTAIAQCAANLEQYDMALQIYGGEYQDNLPTISGANWACDAPLYYTAWLTNTGMKWTSLYCPGTSVRFTEQDNWIWWNIYAAAGFRILGYATTVPGTGSMSEDMTGWDFSTNINTTLHMRRVADSAGGYVQVAPAASRVLVADATLTPSFYFPTTDYAAMLTYDWVYIPNGGPFVPGPGISAHLNGAIPLGGNVGMLDGHVEWRNFTNMVPRAGIFNEVPFFYW
jgi:prepilin-type processing-associated H-X9-DG protein